MSKKTPIPDDLKIDEYILLLRYSMLSEEKKKEFMSEARKLANKEKKNK